MIPCPSWSPCVCVQSFLWLFRAVFDSKQNWEEGTEFFHIPLTLSPQHTHTHTHTHTRTHARTHVHIHAHTHSLLMVNIAHQSGTFVTVEPTLIHHNYLQSLIYIRLHACCSAFCGFGQMYSDVYPSRLYLAVYFHHPENPLCSAWSSLPPSPQPWQPPILLLPH